MPTMPGKITKYNPNTDMVAGKSASQIQAAKRKAVGGKRKKCAKGKSCSATCIAANKVCMVDIPWVAAQGIPKVVAKIENIQEILAAKGINLKGIKLPKGGDKDKILPIVVKPAKPEVKPAKPKVKPTPPGQSGKGPEPEPGKRWEPVPGFVTAEGPKPSLPPLKTTKDFEALDLYMYEDSSLDNNGAMKRLKSFIDDARSSNPSKEAQAALDAVGGIDNFNKGVDGIRLFTGSSYKRVREAQKKLSRGESLNGYEKQYIDAAINAERLLAHLPKERLVKYRGMASSDDRLKATIAASKARSDYQDGALASWSVQLPTARLFARSGKEFNTPNLIIYRTVNEMGAAVKELSYHNNEAEVLTPASAQYQHTGKYEVIKHNGNTYHVFDVIEKRP